MKELKTQYQYGVYVYEHEQEIVNIIEEINNNLDDCFHKAAFGGVCLDIQDINDTATEAECTLELSTQTGEDEDEAIETIKQTIKKFPGATCKIDSYPNVDDDGGSYYSYTVFINT